MSVPLPRNEPHKKVRLYFIQESQSGKAWQFVKAATKKDAGSDFVWLPVSMIWRATKNETKEGENYPMWELTIPIWLVEQKNLASSVVIDLRKVG